MTFLKEGLLAGFALKVKSVLSHRPLTQLLLEIWSGFTYPYRIRTGCAVNVLR